LQLGDIEIAVTRKDVKHVHFSVHPPEGSVMLVAPARSRLEVLRTDGVRHGRRSMAFHLRRGP